MGEEGEEEVERRALSVNWNMCTRQNSSEFSFIRPPHTTHHTPHTATITHTIVTSSALYTFLIESTRSTHWFTAPTPLRRYRQLLSPTSTDSDRTTSCTQLDEQSSTRFRIILLTTTRPILGFSATRSPLRCVTSFRRFDNVTRRLATHDGRR